MRSGRRLGLAILIGAVGAGLVTFACGLDVVGTTSPPVVTVDARPEAALPPGAAGLADAPNRDAEDAEAGPPRCESSRGPAMIELPGERCIDSTEVTAAQYVEFVAATGGGVDAGFLSEDGGTGRPPCCVAQTFAPVPYPGYDASAGDEPVTFVSWCDAYAFCKWSGKHLCTGRQSTDAGASGEWLEACTRSGERTVPYKVGPPDAGVCNVAQSGMAPVKSFAGCTGGYDGLHDMLGNVSELVDECDATTSVCAIYGGYWGSPGTATCFTPDSVSCNVKGYAQGFRCCR